MSLHVNGLVVFAYDHFYPDFSAGGPVTSLYNLAQLVGEKRKVRILSSAYEYQSGHRLQGVEFDCWTNWKGLTIWYAIDRASIKSAITSLSDEQDVTFYLNGIFSPSYFLYPLWLIRKYRFRFVVSPRGMLQIGALRGGRVKKEVYLWLLKSSGLLGNSEWHATDKQEAEDIRTKIDRNAHVVVIPNVPRITVGFGKIKKETNSLRLVYFSLIAKKKNLHFLLDVLNSPDLIKVEMDILGPVKDKSYWEVCLSAMQALSNPERVRYKGEINPDKINGILPRYHALALPTHGENFGHAIIEMLSCSRPIFVSDKTPWNDLQLRGAGYVMHLDKQKWIEGFKEMLAWDQKEFDQACQAAINYYQSKFNFDDLKIRYLGLFSAQL
jgi:glycosyltransferase involved in cell wall biosynthesis